MTINRRKELISADPNQPQTNSETNSETRHLDLNISICLIWFPYLLYADYNCWQRSKASTENKLTLHRVLPDPACWRSQYKAVIMGKLQWWTASTVIPWQFHLPNSHSCLRRVNIVFIWLPQLHQFSTIATCTGTCLSALRTPPMMCIVEPIQQHGSYWPCVTVLAIVAPTNSDTGDHERAEIDTVKSYFVSVLPSSIDDPFLYDVDTANFRMK